MPEMPVNMDFSVWRNIYIYIYVLVIDVWPFNWVTTYNILSIHIIIKIAMDYFPRLIRIFSIRRNNSNIRVCVCAIQRTRGKSNNVNFPGRTYAAGKIRSRRSSLILFSSFAPLLFFIVCYSLSVKSAFLSDGTEWEIQLSDTYSPSGERKSEGWERERERRRRRKSDVPKVISLKKMLEPHTFDLTFLARVCYFAYIYIYMRNSICN